MRTILLADDDSDDQDMLIDALVAEDPEVKVHAVENGRQALAYLSEQAGNNELPGVIVLDYHMPILNAIEVLQEMHEQELYKQIPAVVWSTSRDSDHERMCVEKGAKRYFVKPTSNKLLQAIAREILSFSNE